MMKGIDVIRGIDVITSDSDDDQAGKPSVLTTADQVRSNSVHSVRRRRAEKVWSAPPREEEEEEEDDESKKLISESKPESEEKVGDIVHLDRNSYFIIDIFEKEIVELGDKVDLNFKRFNKFESVYGDAPRDHHFYYNRRCCYSCCCVCRSGNVEKEWGILEKQLALREKEHGSKGVTFLVRTYNERKELMRVAVTLTNGTDQSHSLFFFDLKFPTAYPYEAPSLFYHLYGLPLSTPETQLKPKFCYSILDVFLHIEEIVLKNTNKSCQQMLDMLKRPLAGFEDFVKGHFRKKGALILRNMMDEMDMEKERDKNMFWKMYIAFESNKGYCEHLLNSDLKEELKRFKEKECSSLSDYYSYPTIISRFDEIKKTSKYENLLSKFLPFYD